MTDFDGDFWRDHWSGDDAAHRHGLSRANPYLDRELAGLTPGTALDAGCGTGAEAVWLAGRGWTVVGVDIAAGALDAARRRAEDAGVADLTTWLAADLTTWAPDRPFDLVMTNYAHATIAQTELYERLAGWVAPGGTLLIVGHGAAGHDHEHDAGHDHGSGHDDAGPHAHATTRAAEVAGLLDPAAWTVVTALETDRTPEDATATRLHDVVVRAVRRS
jgi:SAM-dependent methyltransferase